MKPMFGSAEVFRSRRLSDSPLDVVFLNSHENSHSVEICLFGATIISWKSGVGDNKERLFVSQNAFLDGSKPIRGGIPIAFPQFAQSLTTSLPQHGIARTLYWSYMGYTSDETSITVKLQLSDNSISRALWDHSFSLNYNVCLSADSLKTDLFISNTGSESFSCQALFHTYFQIANVHNLEVVGLHGVDYLDKMNFGRNSTEENDSLAIDKEVDRVYVGQFRAESDKRVSLFDKNTDQVCFNIYASSGNLKSNCLESADDFTIGTTRGSSFDTDCVVWNPWIDKSRALIDLNDDGYLNFVCIEPGIVSRHLVVDSGSTVYLSQCIKLS